MFADVSNSSTPKEKIYQTNFVTMSVTGLYLTFPRASYFKENSFEPTYLLYITCLFEIFLQMNFFFSIILNNTKTHYLLLFMVACLHYNYQLYYILIFMIDHKNRYNFDVCIEFNRC